MGTWDTTMTGFEGKDVNLDGLVSICSVALRTFSQEGRNVSTVANVLIVMS